MTNYHGEIDTPPEKLWNRGSFLGCFELCAGSSFAIVRGASSVESEVFEFAVGLTVLVALSRRREKSSWRIGQHEPVARMTLRC
jgi:hypothetical protein